MLWEEAFSLSTEQLEHILDDDKERWRLTPRSVGMEPIEGCECSCNAQAVDNVQKFYKEAVGPDIITMTVMLSISSFLGILGNTVVVVVCTCCRSSSKSVQHYICMIATCDLIICLVLVPYRISAYHVLIPEMVCKIFEGLTYFSESYSLGLLLAVALDRYLAVNHPVYFAHMKYFPGIWAVSTGILLLSVGIPAGLLAGDYVIVPSNKTNTSRQCYTGICDSDGLDQRFFTESGRNIYIWYIAILYMTAFASLVTLYTKVFCVVYEKFGLKSRTPMREPTSCSEASVKSVDVDVIEAPIQAQDMNNTGPPATPANGDNQDTTGPCVPLTIHKRIAKICCMVTLAYFVTWLPFFLMRTRLVPNIITLRLAFFFSNMINPFIYSFSNRKFRGQALSLINYTKGCELFS